MNKIILMILLNVSTLSMAQYNFQWYKTYDHIYGISYYDEAYEMVQDADGNIYVTGASFGEGDDSRYDIATIKYNSNGDSLWVKRFNDGVYSFEQPAAIVLDQQQNVIITGISRLEMVTIKYNSDGQLLWSKRFQDTAYDYRHEAYDVKTDNSDNIYVVGYSTSRDFPGTAAQLLKYDPDGNLVWHRKYINTVSAVLFSTLIFNNNNEIITSGITIDSVYNNINFITVKYDTDGNKLWSAISNISRLDKAVSVLSDSTGNIYVSGYGTDPGDVKNMVLLKYNSSGILQWTRKYPGFYINTSDQFLSDPDMIALDKNDNVIVNFNTWNQFNVYEIATIKYNGSGELIWIKKYNLDEDSSYQETRDLKVSPDGNIFVTAVSAKYYHSDFNTFAILCYENNGNLKNVIRGSNQYDKPFYPMKSVINKDGSIYTTGYTRNNSHITDYFTIKHSLTVGINSNTNLLPLKFNLSQNYPNPFNPMTIINYKCSMFNDVVLKVFDVLGNEVAVLVNEKQNPGSYNVEFDGSGFSSGVYFYKLTAGEFSETKRMVLLK